MSINTVMFGHPTTVELRDKKAYVAYGRVPQNDDDVISKEQKLHLEGAEQFPARPVIGKTKAKRKDGMLEIMCKWLVDNQVGTRRVSLTFS